MAVSKELLQSMLPGSEEPKEEFPCTICLTRDKREVESHKYCVDCDSNLCPACTKYHTSIPKMASHQVVDISQAPGMHKPPLQTQQCDEHQGKIIVKYCEEHAEVACETCISLYHSHCKQFKYIPKIAQGISKTNRLEAVIASTNLLIEELMQKKHSQYNALFELKCEEQESQQEVDDLYSRLYLHIYDLTKSESAKITTEWT